MREEVIHLHGLPHKRKILRYIERLEYFGKREKEEEKENKFYFPIRKISNLYFPIMWEDMLVNYFSSLFYFSSLI